jgi:hypothetical protein
MDLALVGKRAQVRGDRGDLGVEIVADRWIERALGAPQGLPRSRRRLGELDILQAQLTGAGHLGGCAGERVLDLAQAGADEQVLCDAAEVVVDRHADHVRLVCGALELDEHVDRVIKDGVAHDQRAPWPGRTQSAAPLRLGDPGLRKPRRGGGANGCDLLRADDLHRPQDRQGPRVAGALERRHHAHPDLRLGIGVDERCRHPSPRTGGNGPARERTTAKWRPPHGGRCQQNAQPRASRADWI